MTAQPRLPAPYSALRRMLAEFVEPRHVKKFLHQTMAVEDYAFMAKDAELIAHAAEFRKRAERRLGQVIAKLPKAKGGGDQKSDHRVSKKPADAPKPLAEYGIDKNLADRARKAERLSDDDFEALVIKVVKMAVASVENVEQVIKHARAELVRTKLANRKRRHREIREAAAVEKPADIPARKYPLIYADPPWFFKTYTESGGERAPDNHYPTLSDDEIITFCIDGKPMREIAHDDAALFLWCTSSNLPLALNVMAAWGFTFKASAVWKKDKQGTGQIFRNWHEVLLYGSRGKFPGPLYLPPSVFEFPRGKHSAKPLEIRKEIEKMYPEFLERERLEVFARGKVPGWSVYGFESRQAAA